MLHCIHMDRASKIFRPHRPSIVEDGNIQASIRLSIWRHEYPPEYLSVIFSFALWRSWSTLIPFTFLVIRGNSSLVSGSRNIWIRLREKVARNLTLFSRRTHHRYNHRHFSPSTSYFWISNLDSFLYQPMKKGEKIFPLLSCVLVFWMFSSFATIDRRVNLFSIPWKWG